jgi:uncharacterized protein YciI
MGRPGGRPTYYLVEHVPGPSWDDRRIRRAQARWDEHAAFMDALTEEGFIFLGGPVGEGDGDYALLVVVASSEAQVRARLAQDPWADSILTIASVKPWSVWLRASNDPAKPGATPSTREARPSDRSLRRKGAKS